jgi:3-oxoacyl-[acyl-carrier-protein] synthase II
MASRMTSPVLCRLLRDNPIVVTGMGCFSSAGQSVAELWDAAVAGRSTAARHEFGTEAARASFAVCRAPEIDLSRTDFHAVRKMDRCVQMAWLAADQALKQAHLTEPDPATRMGVVVGSSRGPLGKIGESFASDGPRRPLPSLGSNSTFASLSGALAQAFKLHGPGATIAATCASAAFAIGFAAEQILLGKADAMLVGGAESPLHPAILGQLDSAGVLGFHEDPARTCRPFDVTRNGLILGEGSGFLVLESAAAAAARGVPVLAHLAGWAMSLDNAGRVGVNEDGAGLLRVKRGALDLAGLSPHHIGWINAHVSGTKLNDLAEAQAVSGLFNNGAAGVPCSSTKPVTGHCLGATPALEALVCIEALRHQMVPPTAHCYEQDPLCLINVQPLIARSAKLDAVMSNSLGFWGYHASLIFSKP